MVSSGIRNSSAVRVSDDLSGSAECKVLEVQEDAIKFDSRLSRWEASGLEKVEVSLDPNIWAGAFFQGWGAFWCREGGVEQGNPSVVEDLSSLFRRSFSVSSLRFPSFW